MKKFKKLLMLLVIPFIFLSASCSNLNILTETNTFDYVTYVNNITTNYIKATIEIDVESYQTGPMGMHKNISSSQGSGVIFYEDDTRYYALTNNHVVYGNQSSGNTTNYVVKDYKQNAYSAQCIGRSADYDLAVVMFSKQASTTLPTLEFLDSNPITGEVICAVGTPLGQSNAITLGTVNGYGTIKPNENQLELSNVLFDCIVHDAFINNGSSGGLLLSDNYKIAGINFASATDGNDAYLASYAIPVEKIKEFLTKYNINF